MSLAPSPREELINRIARRQDPKKKKTGLVIALVIVSILIVVGIVVTIILVLRARKAKARANAKFRAPCTKTSDCADGYSCDTAKGYCI